MLPPRLLVIHDTGRRSQDNVPKLTRRQQVDDPLLHIAQLHVVARGDDTRLVDAAVELDDNLAVAVVVDLLELADVACTIDVLVWRVLREYKRPSFMGEVDKGDV